jgi:thiamine pyrophosphate-dependent acetolactate synthase large subunit-like protein
MKRLTIPWATIVAVVTASTALAVDYKNLVADGYRWVAIDGPALWRQARENLDVTTVILSNRRYAILEHELAKVGANPGRTALALFDLGRR